MAANVMEIYGSKVFNEHIFAHYPNHFRRQLFPLFRPHKYCHT